MKFNPKLANLFRWTAVLATVIAALHVVGIADYHFSRKVQNDPFENPVQVIQIHDDRLQLDDGRVVWIDGKVERWLRDRLEHDDLRVDLETDSQRDVVRIWGKRPIFYCGLSFPLIVIPIIPRDVPRFERDLIAFGHLGSEAEDGSLSGSQRSDTRK